MAAPSDPVGPTALGTNPRVTFTSSLGGFIVMKSASILTAAVASSALVLFAGCAGSSPSNSASVLPQSRSAARGVILRTGVDTRFAGPGAVLSRLAEPPRRHRRSKVEKDLFVSDEGPTVFELKNGSYAEVGTITNGINDSDGVWVDKKGNVYVANVDGKNVTEYKKGHGAPICTYSSGLVDPINVTTDNAGNVYVVDFNDFNNPGHIDKFAQCSNSVATQYNVDEGPEGVAVDASGDIFVSYFGAQGGNFEEFVGGSTTATPLGASVTSPGGLVLDKNGVLIADDQAGTIDLIAPPYSTTTVFASGLSGPFHDSLNKAETLLFNANHGSGTVSVYSYPSGTLVTTITSANGIDGAEGVGESPDAVF
jgi:hypothetical protein